MVDPEGERGSLRCLNLFLNPSGRAFYFPEASIQVPPLAPTDHAHCLRYKPLDLESTELARDADSKDVSRLAQAPWLIVTFALAPIGVLAWRTIRKSGEPRLDYARPSSCRYS